MSISVRSIPPLEPALEARFWEKIIQKGEDECWEWIAGKNGNGYGVFGIHRKTFLAHRIAFFLVNGPFPDDKPCAIHSCDNPGCCNPKHLSSGTQTENLQDMATKDRLARGEERSIAFTEVEVLQIREIYKNEGVTQRVIALRFGVTQSSISRILSGETWSHLK